MGELYTHFQTKNSAKTIPLGAAHTYMAYMRAYPPQGITTDFIVNVGIFSSSKKGPDTFK